MESQEPGSDRWIGLTYGAMADRVYARVEVCRRKATEHAKAVKRWGAVALPLTWATAVLAALSGLTVIAEQQTAAVFLSIATAVIASTNAALNPAATARLHKLILIAFEQMERKFEDFTYFHTEAEHELVPAERRKELLQQIQTLEDELSAIERG